MTLIEGIQHGSSGGAAPKAAVLEMPLHGGVVLSAVRLEHQQVVGLAIHNPLGDILLQPMASSVTRVFPSIKLSSNSGMAVISLDLSSTRRWPSTRFCSLAHALTKCSGDC